MSSPTVHLGESEVDLVSSNLRLCTRCILTLSSLSDSSVQFPKSQLDLSKSSMLLVLPPNCSSPRPPSSSASLTSNLRLLASSPLTSTSCSSFLSSSSPSCPSALPTSSTTTSDSSPPVSESSLSSSQCQASKATCSPSKTAPATFNKLYYSLCSSPLTGSLKSPCEWIVRGGGLKLSIEPLDGNYFTSSHFLDAAFKKGLCSILTQAELWSQVLLVATPCFANSTEGLQFNLRTVPHSLETSACPAIIGTADVHDIRPPPGVDVVSLDSIKLMLKLVPSTGLDDGFKKRKEKATQGETVTFPDPCLAASRDEVNAETLLGLGFRDTHVKDSSVKVCEAKKYLRKLSATDANPLFGNGSFSPLYQQTNKTVKRPRASSITSLTDPDPRLLVRLVDASLRLALDGSHVVQRGDLISNAPGIKIHHYRFDRGLADFAPALFRPGYLPAIAHRSPFIPSIASSLFSIISRNKSHPAQPSAPSILGLQTKLWRLLAEKDWPSEKLRPLDYTSSTPFEQAAEGEEILDGNINASEASQPTEEGLLFEELDDFGENLFDPEEDSLFVEVGVSTQESWVSLESEIAVGDNEASLFEEEWAEWSQKREEELGNRMEDGELLL